MPKNEIFIYFLMIHGLQTNNNVNVKECLNYYCRMVAAQIIREQNLRRIDSYGTNGFVLLVVEDDNIKYSPQRNVCIWRQAAATING